MTTQPHPEPSEEASSLPVVTHLRQEAQDFEALVADGGSSCPDVALGMAAQRRAWADAIDQLRAELERKSDAIQKLWKERDEARAELAALKAAPAVDVERCMALAEAYADEVNKYLTCEPNDQVAAREALRASLASPEGSQHD